MAVLFLGEEATYRNAIESGVHENGFPIFFAPALPEPGNIAAYELDTAWGHDDLAAIVVPARYFLSLAPLQFQVPVLASGPPVLLAECIAAGCADYLREPWTMDELEARLSRCAGFPGSRPKDSTSWDGHTLIGPCGGLRLSIALAAMLKLFLANRGAFIPREALAAAIGSPPVQGRAIDMQVSRLRGIFRQLGMVSSASSLQAIPGGYRFCQDQR